MERNETKSVFSLYISTPIRQSFHKREIGIFWGSTLVPLCAVCSLQFVVTRVQHEKIRYKKLGIDQAFYQI